jgi:hypothetical protein
MIVHRSIRLRLPWLGVARCGVGRRKQRQNRPTRWDYRKRDDVSHLRVAQRCRQERPGRKMSRGKPLGRIIMARGAWHYRIQNVQAGLWLSAAMPILPPHLLSPNHLHFRIEATMAAKMSCFCYLSPAPAPPSPLTRLGVWRRPLMTSLELTSRCPAHGCAVCPPRFCVTHLSYYRSTVNSLRISVTS